MNTIQMAIVVAKEAVFKAAVIAVNTSSSVPMAKVAVFNATTFTMDASTWLNVFVLKV
jgi:hypothetical protein